MRGTLLPGAPPTGRAEPRNDGPCRHGDDDALVALLDRAERHDDPELRRCAAVLRRRLRQPRPPALARGVRYVDLRELVRAGVARLPEEHRRDVHLTMPDHPVVVRLDPALVGDALEDLLVRLLDATTRSTIGLRVIGQPGGGDLLADQAVVMLTVTAPHRRLSSAEVARVGSLLASTNPAHHASTMMLCDADAASFIGPHLSVHSDSAGTRVRASWPLDLG